MYFSPKHGFWMVEIKKWVECRLLWKKVLTWFMGKQLNPVHAFPSLKPHFTDAIASNFFLIRIKKDVVHQVTSSVYYLLHQPFRLINIISCRSRGIKLQPYSTPWWLCVSFVIVGLWECCALCCWVSKFSSLTGIQTHTSLLVPIQCCCLHLPKKQTIHFTTVIT